MKRKNKYRNQQEANRKEKQQTKARLNGEIIRHVANEIDQFSEVLLFHAILEISWIFYKGDFLDVSFNEFD